MPKYRFICKNCKTETSKFVPRNVEEIVCSACGSTMDRQLPNINSQTEVRELVDPYLNKRLNKDHKEIMRERRTNYFREVEIPRLVEKYSLETCLEQKWLVYNDKGELVINKDWVPSPKQNT
jgi:transcription elongation factor Elf1